MLIKRFVFTFLVLMCTGVAAPATQGFDNSPVRFWSFSKYVVGSPDPILVDGGAQQGGKLNETENFGTIAFNLEPPSDDFATENIFSKANGKTFSVYAEAPVGSIDQAGDVIGSDVVLDQYQSYEKRNPDATLKITVSDTLLETLDTNASLLSETECPAPQNVCPLLQAFLTFEARVYSLGAGGDFFHTKGHALIIGYKGHWQFFAGSSADVGKPMWDVHDFSFIDPEDLGMHKLAFITDPNGVTLNVDLSPVTLGELFAVEVRMEVQTFDARGGESGIIATIRDPEKILPTVVQTTGLKRKGAPPMPPPPPDPPQPASCDVPNPDAGTVQFSDPTYVVGEWSGPIPTVIVTRTGGSTGPASVTLTTSPGTAEAGVDYEELNKTIVFADGDTSPRMVELPIIHDSLTEPAETFNVTLSSPQCATLGDQTTAEVTIIDDDTLMAPPQQFTIGGTVSGLTGTGLVLVNQGSDPLSIDADGTFQFSAPVPVGGSYDVAVATQPSSPNQVCTVTNGAGTVTDHDITDVLVECSTTQTSGLDPTFGSGGIVSTQFGEELQAVILQPDGSIVSAGTDGADFALTRHTSSGALDTTFDGDGKVTTDFAGGGIAGDEAFGLALQSDGNIVAVGSADSTRTFKDFAIVRYLPDGSLDAGFGTGGKVTLDFGVDTDGDGIKESGDDVATAVAIQPDGKILVSGHVGLPKGGGLGFQNDFAVVRYNPDGTLDPTFGNGGIVTTNVGSDTDLANDMVLQPDGRIVVAGETNQAEDFAIVRYNNDGSLDTNFAATGIVVTDFGRAEGFSGVALQADGKIIAVGNTLSRDPKSDFAVVRYNAEGSLDASFGTGGLVATDVSGVPSGFDSAKDVAIQQDGRIVVIGFDTSNTRFDFAMVRYDADGAIDSTFVDNGILRLDFHGNVDFGQDVVIQPDGKIVGAGHAVDGTHFDFELVRVLP